MKTKRIWVLEELDDDREHPHILSSQSKANVSLLISGECTSRSFRLLRVEDRKKFCSPDEMFIWRDPVAGDWVRLECWDSFYEVIKIEANKIFIRTSDGEVVIYSTIMHKFDWIIRDDSAWTEEPKMGFDEWF